MTSLRLSASAFESKGITVKMSEDSDGYSFLSKELDCVTQGEDFEE